MKVITKWWQTSIALHSSTLPRWYEKAV